MRAVGEQDATVDAKELRTDAGIMLDAGDIVMRWLILDRDDDVLDQIGEALETSPASSMRKGAAIPYIVHLLAVASIATSGDLIDQML